MNTELEEQILDRLDQLDLMLEEVIAKLTELEEGLSSQSSIVSGLKRSVSDIEDNG